LSLEVIDSTIDPRVQATLHCSKQPQKNNYIITVA